MDKRNWIPNTRTIIVWLGAALGLIFIYSIRRQLLPVLSPFLFALLLSYLIAPFVEALNRKGVPRNLSILIMYALFVCGLVAVGVFVIPSIVKEVDALIKQMPRLTAEVQRFIVQLEEQYSRINLPPSVTESIQQSVVNLQNYLLRLLNEIPQFIFSLAGRIMTIILIPILSFYMLKDVEQIKRGLIEALPNGYRGRFIALFSKIDEKIGAWIRGQLTIGFIVGFLTFVGLEIVGMDFALLLGIIVGITNIIPYFGPIIGAAPAILLALLRSPSMAMRVLIVQVIAQQIESSFITPQILGKQLGMHPLLIIFSLLLGAQFGGLLGLLFAVPVAAVIKVVAEYFIEAT